MLSVFRRAWCVALALVALLPASVCAQNDAARQRVAIERMYPVMLAALETRNFGRARNICEQAIVWEPQNPVHHYNLACIEAQAGGTRLPYAWGALDLSVALGFNDVDHLQTDPDLAPLRSDPRFADLVRKMILGGAADVRAAGATSSPEKRSAKRPGSDEVLQPPPAGFKDELPVGLYLMSRYVPTIQEHETIVWYFSTDHHVYRGLKNGFSAADLDAHQGNRGIAARAGRVLEVTWSDGTKTTAEVEHDASGFTWDMGIFVPVEPFRDESDAAGVYEGFESDRTDINDLPITLRLELRADHSFTWDGVGVESTNSGTAETLLGSKHSTTGEWHISGLSLILTTDTGATLRRFAFPEDDDRTVIRPDRIFFSGLMYKRRP